MLVISSHWLRFQRHKDEHLVSHKHTTIDERDMKSVPISLTIDCTDKERMKMSKFVGSLIDKWLGKLSASQRFISERRNEWETESTQPKKKEKRNSHWGRSLVQYKQLLA